MSDGPDPHRLDVGTAGASARRVHERRRANREARIRERHPRIGGALLALQDEPTHEAVWARGAKGEEHVATLFGERLRAEAIVLHDRRIPRSRANIDHIAVAPSGIWVIDTKRYTGNVAVHASLIGKAKLTIDGRDRTTLIDGLATQVASVADASETIAPGAPIHGALCIVDAGLPLLGTLTFRGFPLMRPRRLAKHINRGGMMTTVDIRAAAGVLAERFPAA